MKNRNINIIFVILLVALVFFLLFFTEKYSIQNYSTLEKSLIFIGTFLAAYILFNIFEFLYFLFVSMLLSVATNRTYRDSMNFVTSTYCTGLILYIIIVVFIVLCIVE